MLASGADNPFLFEGLRRVNRLQRLLDYRTLQYRDRLVHECEDHLKLLELIAAKENVVAAAFLRDHLDQARVAKARLIAGEDAMPRPPQPANRSRTPRN